MNQSRSRRGSFGRDSVRGNFRNNFHKSRPSNVSGSGNGQERRKFGNKIKYMDARLIVKKEAELIKSEPYQAKYGFSDFNIAEKIKQNILTKGYKTPTPIQDQTINHVLEGKDVVGIANTGTGKTAAFLIPLINKVYIDRGQKVLIVAPTRELAVQIRNEFNDFTLNAGLESVLCIGGVNINPQIRALKQPFNFVIGTPGRIKDLKNQNKLNIASFSTIVLDEVDRMLDMGFIHDIKFIISHLPKYRQSLFFSATMTPAVTEIMHSLSPDPVTVSVKKQETSLNVDQDVVNVRGVNKLEVLHDLLISDGFEKVLIFGRTKWGVEKLSRALTQRGFRVAALHGNKNQNQRQRALEDFRNNKINILLATDVAARGLDIDGITHVINYELPETYDDYVHRIGRTGRAERKGTALTLID